MISIQATRRLALALPGAVEMPHFDRPSFRVGEPGRKPRIFATLWPDERRAVAMLTPDQQDQLVEARPRVYFPVYGTWGLMGATFIDLRAATTADVRHALTLAWTKAAPRSLHAALTPRPTRTRAGASGTTPKPKRSPRSDR